MAKSKMAPMSTLTEGEVLSPALAGVQMQAEGREPEPRVVKLVPVAEPGADQPPVPPVAKPSPAPRCIHQNERAPEGLKRFKIRALNYGDQPMRYVLARDEAEARAHYLRAVGLTAVMAELDRQGGDVETPRLMVRCLPD